MRKKRCLTTTSPTILHENHMCRSVVVSWICVPLCIDQAILYHPGDRRRVCVSPWVSRSKYIQSVLYIPQLIFIAFLEKSLNIFRTERIYEDVYTREGNSETSSMKLKRKLSDSDGMMMGWWYSGCDKYKHIHCRLIESWAELGVTVGWPCALFIDFQL